MEDQPCVVSPAGDKILIALKGNGGIPREITLSFDEASALAITLPRLLTAAMSRKFDDATLRHVYPAVGYTVECASDQRHLLLTLSCGGGFDVIFAVDVNMVASLTRDLAAGQALLETPQTQRPN